MLNVEYVKERFLRYARSFLTGTDPDFDRGIKVKIAHTLRVLEITKKIVKTTDFNEEEAKLACIIALLHDVGRFPQWQKFQSYVDTDECNHCDLGEKILKDEKLLKVFIPKTREYDEIILKAVKLHGRLELPLNLSREERAFCELLRDADRTDILYLASKEKNFDFLFAHYPDGDRKLNPRIAKLLHGKSSVNFKFVRNKMDILALRVSLIWQYTFIDAMLYVKKERYLEKMIALFEEKYPEYDKDYLALIKEEVREFYNVFEDEDP